MVNWFIQTIRIFTCFSIQTIRTLNFIFVSALVSIMQGNAPSDNDSSDLQPSNQHHWCVCGKCQNMPLEIENMCCEQHCMMCHHNGLFESAVLDVTVLSVFIVNHRDMFAEDPEYS